MSTETVTAAGRYCITELPMATGLLMINGTVSPATFDLEILDDAGNWLPVIEGSYTDVATKAIDTEVARTVSLNVTGTPGGSVTATILST
jgi:hypothetical protein